MVFFWRLIKKNNSFKNPKGDLFKRIQTLVNDGTGVLKNKINMSSSLMDDLGFNSLDVVELCMAIETEFSIEIDDSDMEKFKTIADVYNYMRGKKDVMQT